MEFESLEFVRDYHNNFIYRILFNIHNLLNYIITVYIFYNKVKRSREAGPILVPRTTLKLGFVEIPCITVM